MLHDLQEQASSFKGEVVDRVHPPGRPLGPGMEVSRSRICATPPSATRRSQSLGREQRRKPSRLLGSTRTVNAVAPQRWHAGRARPCPPASGCANDMMEARSRARERALYASRISRETYFEMAQNTDARSKAGNSRTTSAAPPRWYAASSCDFRSIHLPDFMWGCRFRGHRTPTRRRRRSGQARSPFRRPA